MFRLKIFLPVLCLACSASLFASPASAVPGCAAATLSTYINSFPFPQTNGCAIGILDYSNFSYHPVSNAPLAGDISLSPSGQGFNFMRTDNQPFTASLGEIVKFEIDFNIFIDPAPVIGGADNRLDPPTGNVIVTEYFCNDSIYFYTGTCFGGPLESLSVGTPVTPYPLSNSIIFQDPARRYQTVGILFTLDGTNGPASFDALNATTQVNNITPEPASLWLVGTFVLAGGYKLRKRRKS